MESKIERDILTSKNFKQVMQGVMDKLVNSKTGQHVAFLLRMFRGKQLITSKLFAEEKKKNKKSKRRKIIGNFYDAEKHIVDELENDMSAGAQEISIEDDHALPTSSRTSGKVEIVPFVKNAC